MMDLAEIGAHLMLHGRKEFSEEIFHAGRDVEKLAIEAEVSGKKAAHGIERIGIAGGVMSTAVGKAAAIGKAALLGIAGVAIAAGAYGIEMADKYEVGHAKLEAALKGAGTSWEDYKDRVAVVSKQMEKLGFANGDTEAALAQFTVSLRNPNKGLKEMGLAADLARYKNIPLADAAILVAKAMEGQLRPLRALGIDLPVVAGGAAKLEAAHKKLTAAQDAQHRILVKFPGAMSTASKHHDQYEAAVRKTHAAQSALSAQQKESGIILDALHKRMAGQAAAAALTFGGRVNALKVEIQDLGAKLGMWLIPYIEKAVDKIKGGIEWMQKHRTVTRDLAIAIGVFLVGSIVTYIGTLVWAAGASVVNFVKMIILGKEFAATQEAGFGKSIALMIRWIAIQTFNIAKTVVMAAVQLTVAAATGAWTAAQWLLNAALNANPIGLIIAGIALLVVGIIIAYKHSETFRKIVSVAFHAVLGAAQAVWHWFQRSWPLLLAILTGPIGIAVLVIHRHWGAIKAGAAAAKDWIVDKWNDLMGFFNGLPARMTRAVSGLWNGLKDGFKAVVNWVIDKWNGLEFRIPSVDTHIPGVGKVGGFSLGTPDIPRLHTGGTVTAPGSAVIRPGEEMVVLPQAASVIPLPSGSGALSESLAALQNGDGGPKIFQVILDRKVLAEAVYGAAGDSAARK